jgi:hypothetical protein
MNQELNFTARDWFAVAMFGGLLTGAILGAICSIAAIAVVIQ